MYLRGGDLLLLCSFFEPVCSVNDATTRDIVSSDGWRMNTSETRQSVNWILGQGARGIERLEARLCGWGFSLHRHDNTVSE
jgi:hypothetical protein